MTLNKMAMWSATAKQNITISNGLNYNYDLIINSYELKGNFCSHSVMLVDYLDLSK